MVERKLCFVISPIGLPGSVARSAADEVFDGLISRAVDSEKYIVERADQIDRSGIAMNTVFSKVEGADLVVADVTDGNPNVFYELAIRHATRLPCIIIANSGTVLPFDIGGVSVIYYNMATTRELHASTDRLRRAIDDLDVSSDNPFSEYLASKRTLIGTTRDQGRGAAAAAFFKNVSTLHGPQVKRIEGSFIAYHYSIYTANSEDYGKPFIRYPTSFSCQDDHVTLLEKSFDDEPWVGFGVITHNQLIGVMRATSRPADTLAMVIAIPESARPKILYGAQLFISGISGRCAFSRPVAYVRAEDDASLLREAGPVDASELPDRVQRYLLSDITKREEPVMSINSIMKVALVLRAEFSLI